jgi:hypothetical protein
MPWDNVFICGRQRSCAPMTAPVPAPEADAYLPLKRLSDYAGISVRTLRERLSHPSHPLPHYRISGKILVKRSEFDAWMTGYRRATPSRVDAIVKDVLKGL